MLRGNNFLIQTGRCEKLLFALTGSLRIFQLFSSVTLLVTIFTVTIIMYNNNNYDFDAILQDPIFM
jgi:hypothetical protein